MKPGGNFEGQVLIEIKNTLLTPNPLQVDHELHQHAHTLNDNQCAHGNESGSAVQKL